MSAFEDLNPGQREAVLTTEGPVLIIAGPGTGKTYTLVKRLAHLVVDMGVKPGEIMVLTFTEKAGRELVTRISDELVRRGVEINLNEMYIGTFHSVCLRLLKEDPAFVQDDSVRMLDAFEQTYLVCRNIDTFRLLRGFSERIPQKGAWKQSLEICRYVNLMMEELADTEAMEADPDEDMRFLGKLTRRYRELLRRSGAMDFSTILLKTYEMLRSNRGMLEQLQNSIRYIMVDEYQDTNYIQEQLVLLLAGERRNICAVGDDDQGLYRFRGATVQNILEFPAKLPGCGIIHLKENYRSEPGIVEFYDRWMENARGQDLFTWDDFRYLKDITAKKERRLAGPSVFSCLGKNLDEEKSELLEALRRLLTQGNINDLNQVVFLFRSVKSDEASELGAFFEANGVPVYSPRSDLFFERDEVRLLLGGLLYCFAGYMDALRQNIFTHAISGFLRQYYIDCLRVLRDALRADGELRSCLEGLRRQVSDIRETSNTCLLDLFYSIIACRPFREYLDSPLGDVLASRAARNLSEISRMLSKFSFLHNMHGISGDNRFAMAEELFNIYLRYMIEDGIGEYEDETEAAPRGCVSFMTVHQAKGLEFPAVVTCSLGNRPSRCGDPLLYSAESRYFHRKPFEPLSDVKFFDFWRLYYTAFSRARELLILASSKPDSPYFGEYLRDLPDISEFQETVPFSVVKPTRYKRVYSFTSHISVYDGCPTQYKFYKEYGFAQNSMLHTSLGSLVHATLEDLNRRAIAGHPEEVDPATIEGWFAANLGRMRYETGFSLTDGQREDALRQVLRYYEHRKNELGHVWKAEEEINLVLLDFILQGVIDLIEGHGDTVEIVDYKTGPKPDATVQPEMVEHYRKQLEIYAYLVEKRYGKKVSRMHLYYTSVTDGDPLITFEWTRAAVDRTIGEVAETVRKIEGRDFEGGAANSYACKYCDMRRACGKAK